MVDIELGANSFEVNRERDYKDLAIVREQLKREDLSLEEERALKTQEQDFQKILNPKQPR